MTTIRRVAVLVSVAGLASLGVAACGDDDDGGGDALTEEEFLAQGNEICSAGNDELDAAFAEFGDEEPTPEEISAFADTFEENVGDQIDAVDDLEGPDDIEEQLDPVLADARDDLEEFATLLREDPEAAFSQEEDPFADVNEQLADIGLTECAGGE